MINGRAQFSTLENLCGVYAVPLTANLACILHYSSLDGIRLGADRCPYSQSRACSLRLGTKEAVMIVKNILAGKGGNVITINPTADVIMAVKLMAERGIGAVVVLGADHRVVGILSERDIVKALAEHGSAVLSELVSQVMTREVKTCSEDDTIGDLMGRMTTGRFRHMPVVQQETLVGIVSIGDVVKSRVEEIGQETKTLREYIQTA
jgi:CBS domain-containing protein